MQNNESLPRGFKRLSDRYPLFPILLGGGKSLRALDPRGIWKWKWKQWLADQWEEATGEKPPIWLARSDRWILTLVDGRRYLLTEEEKEAYMHALEVHDLAMLWSKGAEMMQNQYKRSE